MNRRADLRFVRKDQQTTGVVAQPKLSRTAKHSFAFNAPQFVRANFHLSGQLRARQSQRNLIAELVIFRSANNLPQCAAPIVYCANGQPICVRMLCRFDNLRHDDLREVSATFLHRLNFDAGKGQQLGQSLDP